MKGLANEVPIFIKTYDVKDEAKMAVTIASVKTRLNNEGITVATVDLFDMVVQILAKDGQLDRLLEKEPRIPKRQFLDVLRGAADPAARLIPELLPLMGKPDVKLTFITGIGHVYPFLRAHSILESLQPQMMPHPVIMFFPGQYTFLPGLGSQLALFGMEPSKKYYRAFNLDDYHL